MLPEEPYMTLEAATPDGRRVTFTDYVKHGAEVAEYEEPETEQGLCGIYVCERYGPDDWRLRDLTPTENQARTDRIMAAAAVGRAEA